MAPTNTSDELWGHYSMPQKVEVDCLLPNSMLVTILCSKETLLSDLRVLVWLEAKRLPYFVDLKPADNYVFSSVTQDAKCVEFYDDSKRICDLRLFYTFFKLNEVQGNLEENLINADISKAIGFYVNEIEQSKELEFIKFRLELLRLLKQMLSEHDKASSSLIESIYTPHLEIDPSLLDVSVTNTVNSLNEFNLGSGGETEPTIGIDIHVIETNQPAMVYHLNIPFSFTPVDMVAQIIKIKLNGLNQSTDEIDEIVNRYKDAYMLNVCGCDEIFHGSKSKIISYKVGASFVFICLLLKEFCCYWLNLLKYIKRCMSTGRTPSFHLISIEKLKSKLPRETHLQHELIDKCEHYWRNFKTTGKLSQLKCLDLKQQEAKLALYETVNLNSIELSWNSKETFSFYLDSIVYLPQLKDCDKVIWTKQADMCFL